MRLSSLLTILSRLLYDDFLGSGSSDDSDDEESDKNDSDWSVDSEKIRKKRKIFDREQRKRLKQFNIGRRDYPE